MSRGLKYIDLFAGAGGLSEGFKRAGFDPVAHVEMDNAACFSLKTRSAYYFLKENNKSHIYGSYLKGEINRDELYSLVPNECLESVINLAIGKENNQAIFDTIERENDKKDIDLIVGGPPCQAYSLAGRSRNNGMKQDPRNYLFFEYIKFLERYNPKIFVFENVLGLKSANDGNYFKTMLNLFAKQGYEVADFVLHADDFGVLQKRKRVILIGYKKELNFTLPNFEPIQSAKFSVANIFSDLPQIEANGGVDKFLNYRTDVNEYLSISKIRNEEGILTQHISRPHTDQDKEIYRIAVDLWSEKKERLNYINLPDRLKTHLNQTSFFDRFKVVAADLGSSQTVVAHIAKDGHYYIHPDIEQNRSISVREAARLQSFPDDFYFEGVKESKNRTAAFKQIGNAVPPLMAQNIAAELIKFI
ncbi:DNA cytosine methyltransferase [Mucilaginibacter sp.]|uniref:DNA cytosine methyltransferase n=1 Tax=Mucilaginibacter sp. TaxID=1882438 RepID=UPI0035BC542B